MKGKTPKKYMVNEQIESIQGLRLLAFLGVFVSHIGGICDRWGAWGVSVFLTLSGFLMTYSYRDREMALGVRDRLFFSIGKEKIVSTSYCDYDSSYYYSRL